MRFLAGFIIGCTSFYVLLNLATAGVISWPWFIVFIVLDVIGTSLTKAEK